MSWDWKGTLSTVAPMLATAYGTPLAGMATRTILSALGIVPSPKATEEDNQQLISDKLQNTTPAEFLAIKNAEYQFKKDMKSLDVDLDKIAAGDRESARKMQTETRSWALPVLATVVTVGFFGILLGVMKGYLSVKESPEVLLLIGSLGTAFGMVMQFHFGSSSGSQRKDATIQNLSK